MQYIFLVAFLLFGGIGISLAQEVISGKCKDFPVNVVQNFDASKYTGIWYEQARYEAIFQLNMDCVTANYTARDDAQIGVINSGKVFATGKESRIEGVARFVDPSKHEAKLLVKFPVSPEGNYWVIGTDYTSYSVVWSCTEILPGILSTNIQFLWILSREPKLAEDKMAEVKAILNAAKLDQSKLRITKQDGCGWSNNV